MPRNRQSGAQLHDRSMRLADGAVEKALRVQHWMSLGAEHLVYGLNRQLSGPGSPGMAAHPVDSHEQSGAFLPNDFHPVLILRAIT